MPVYIGAEILPIWRWPGSEGEEGWRNRDEIMTEVVVLVLVVADRDIAGMSISTKYYI